MRQKPSAKHALIRIDQRALPKPAVVRLVMLKTEMRNVIAQTEHKVIVAIVLGSEEGGGCVTRFLYCSQLRVAL